MQLVRDGVEMLDPIKQRPIGPAEVMEKFGVPPEKVVDVQALAGDSVDNVPGVPGIGVKTAAQLITEYGDVETLLARAGEIKQPKRRETLQNFADQVRLSRDLVTLQGDVPVAVPLEDLAVQDPEPTQLIAFLEEMEFRTITRRVREQMEKEGAIAPAPPSEVAPIDRSKYACIRDLKTLEDWVIRAVHQGWVAVDTETDALDSVGGGLEEPPQEGGLQEPPGAEGAQGAAVAEAAKAPPAEPAATPPPPAAERLPVPAWFWAVLGVGVVFLLVLYAAWTWQRLEVFKKLLSSFFPLALLILAVLGSIVFGFATPTEAAAVGAFGGFILAAIYRFVAHAREAGTGGSALARTAKELGSILKDSSFLTAKTSAMVCWLFVGSSIFAAAFALLGGQEIVEKWVLSLGLSPVQFMILAQFIIFILGWPLEWTEIIVIFMPIFIPLLDKFGIDPLFFGLLVALNLQTAFLSPPVAMSAFYLKGVAPKHVTLNQIFAGMMPFMGIQIVALALLYIWPQIGLWLPSVLYGR
jgi:TRAP-type C4-dicarboxylate transport system permease large subunit